MVVLFSWRYLSLESEDCVYCLRKSSRTDVLQLAMGLALLGFKFRYHCEKGLGLLVPLHLRPHNTTAWVTNQVHSAHWAMLPICPRSQRGEPNVLSSRNVSTTCHLLTIYSPCPRLFGQTSSRDGPFWGRWGSLHSVTTSSVAQTLPTQPTELFPSNPSVAANPTTPLSTEREHEKTTHLLQNTFQYWGTRPLWSVFSFAFAAWVFNTITDSSTENVKTPIYSAKESE